jgi:hypothetical protein
MRRLAAVIRDKVPLDAVMGGKGSRHFVQQGLRGSNSGSSPGTSEEAGYWAQDELPSGFRLSVETIA